MTATTLHDLALVWAASGDRRSAESLFRKVMDTHRKALGESHPLVAVTLNSLSRVLRDEGRYDEAAAALEAALEIARPALGDDHQLVAIYTLNLASIAAVAKGARGCRGADSGGSPDPAAVASTRAESPAHLSGRRLERRRDEESPWRVAHRAAAVR